MLATHNLKQLTVQVVTKGEIVKSEIVVIPNTKKHVLDIKPTQAMLPVANVIVFYLTDDGEIISDSTKIVFEKELSNQIQVDLSKSQTKPGENLEISVKTSPGSFVGLLGVDQSVLILKKGNDIEASEVFSEIERYDDTDKYNYVWSPNYDWNTYKTFQDSKVIMITNAKRQYGK